jgi:hypothetical protein
MAFTYRPSIVGGKPGPSYMFPEKRTPQQEAQHLTAHARYAAHVARLKANGYDIFGGKLRAPERPRRRFRTPEEIALEAAVRERAARADARAARDKKAVSRKTQAARVTKPNARRAAPRGRSQSQRGRMMEIDSGAGYREALARKAQRELNARYSRRA